MSAVFKLKELKLITQKSTPAAVRRALEKDGIIVFGQNEGIWTTEGVIELAARVRLGLEKPDPDKKDYF